MGNIFSRLFFNDSGLDKTAKDLKKAANEAARLRNANKGRSGTITRRGINAAKSFAESVGKQGAGILGERGLKLRGIVGAGVGLLAVDKAAQIIRDLVQGSTVKDAVIRVTKEVIPPLLRETIPQILFEFNRRRLADEAAARQALQFNQDLESRIRDTPVVADAARKLWTDRWEGTVRKDQELFDAQSRRF